jgi:hypothetical protein
LAVSDVWASEFREILPVLQQRADLRGRVVALVAQDMPGRVTEGGDRLQRFRTILIDLVEGRLTLQAAYAETAQQLPRGGSPHAGSNRVFAAGWEERLVRTQLSRLYNQAVLEHLTYAGEARCFVPHSSEEDPGSVCSRLLAGREHDVAELHHRLVESYTLGQWARDPKVPEHPHCTHVVRPVTKKAE